MKKKIPKNKLEKIFNGQVLLEFTFCMIIVFLMIYGLVMVLRWTGLDLAQRRKAHDQTLFLGNPTGGETNYEVVDRQLEPNFYRKPIKMNAVWGEAVGSGSGFVN